MFSQFFVLSLRGDTILHKDCKFLFIITSTLYYFYANISTYRKLFFPRINQFMILLKWLDTFSAWCRAFICFLMSDEEIKLAYLNTPYVLSWLTPFFFLLAIYLVRKDLEVVKHTSYNSTQEMFLAQVGIQNSFSEDQEGC